MKSLGFRARVLLALVLFAVVPTGIILLGGATAVRRTLPLLAGSQAWDSVAITGHRALAAAREAPLNEEQREALADHEEELAASVTQARRVSFLAERAAVLAAVFALVGVMMVALLASRVAGHLSRQLSRPVRELVGWTELIARGEPLPLVPPKRGAPEFERLREGMRSMADELGAARAREREAERLAAFRETARRVAHELKNPLTPIRFAVERLRRDAPPELADVVEVLGTESVRLEAMARSFAQFGRLPEGPAAEVDLGELARYAVRSTIPEEMEVRLDVDPVPLVRGHYDALARALTNVLLNSVEACGGRGQVNVAVGSTRLRGREAVQLTVSDSGCGIEPDELQHIWNPYVTTKAGGTGLGLAIVRQTVLAHDGEVEVRSTPGKGTEMRLIVPVDGVVHSSGTP